MKNLQSKIFGMLEKLETHPATLLPDVDYRTLRSFLWGYFRAIENTMDISFHWNITKWVQVKTGKVTSIPWQEHIYYHAANKDEKMAFEISLRYLREYLEENADTLFAEKE